MTLRKLALLLAVLCLSLCLFACGEPADTPDDDSTSSPDSSTTTTTTSSKKELTIAEQYAEALAKMSALTTYEAKADMDISMEMQGMEIDMPISMHIKTNMNGTEIDNLWMDMETSMLGQEMTIEVYFEDGVAYYDTMGTKYKQEMSAEELGVSAVDVPEFDEDIFKDAIRNEKDGKTSVSVTFDGNKYQEMMMDIAASGSSGTDLSVLENLTISDVEVAYVINKDGYITELSMSFSMEGTEPTTNTAYSLTMDMDMEYINPGKDVTVPVPSDLDSYMEMDEL